MTTIDVVLGIGLGVVLIAIVFLVKTLASVARLITARNVLVVAACLAVFFIFNAEDPEEIVARVKRDLRIEAVEFRKHDARRNHMEINWVEFILVNPTPYDLRTIRVHCFKSGWGMGTYKLLSSRTGARTKKPTTVILAKASGVESNEGCHFVDVEVVTDTFPVSVFTSPTLVTFSAS